MILYAALRFENDTIKWIALQNKDSAIKHASSYPHDNIIRYEDVWLDLYSSMDIKK